MNKNKNIICCHSDKIYIHKTRDGTRIPIHKLKTDHLKNIINLAKKYKDNVDSDSMNIYLNELDIRNAYPDEFIMNESNRFESIEKTEFNCTKKECSGVINEYKTESETQVFCNKCWVQHGPIERYTLYSGMRLSEIIEDWEVGWPSKPDWLDDDWYDTDYD